MALSPEEEAMVAAIEMANLFAAPRHRAPAPHTTSAPEPTVERATPGRFSTTLMTSPPVPATRPNNAPDTNPVPLG